MCSECDKLTAELSESESGNADLQRENSNLRQTIDDLQYENRQLQQTLDAKEAQ